MRARFLHPAIFLISFVGIAYQVSLMRIFAIAQWHHFAYMMISLAMLGFAAGGTFLSILRRRIAGREVLALCLFSFLLAGSLVFCYRISQKIPFETYQLISQPKQFGYLFCLYVVLAVPFFFAACAILTGFYLNPAHIGKVYCFNMAGSGLGAAGIVILMFFVKPEALPYLLTVPAASAFLLLLADQPRRFFAGTLALAVTVFILLYNGIAPIRISEYKGLSYALRMPQAKVISQSQSPFSMIHAVSSSMIRETPGQISFRYSWKKSGVLSEQAALFFDADSISAINRFDGNLNAFSYLDYVTGALPYHLIRPDKALILGAGGGTDVLMALSHGVHHVTAVEVDPGVFAMIRNHFQKFSGGLYDRSDVRAVIAEGRGFLQSQEDFYDLIYIPPLDSFNASSAGVYALNESYLYTVEALTLYAKRLTPEGILAITRWLKTPPRDELKIFATMIEAAEKAGIRQPAAHMAFIRSWNTATILLSRSAFKPSQIEAVRNFIQTREFDAGYYPGMSPAETNRFTVLDQPIYETAIQQMLFGNRREFYDGYLFDIRPATDNRPYFFQFFKWKSFPKLLKEMGTEWIPFVEWGYLTLIATILQAVAASAILILLPLVIASGFRNPESREKGGDSSKKAAGWVFYYFSAIGFAYMFLEIVFIQKFMLLLAYPLYAVAVVLTSFLLFSGMGSFFADRFQGRKSFLVSMSVASLIFFALTYLIFLPFLFPLCAHWNDLCKIAVSIVLLAPLAFSMGMPFPTGMQMISDRFNDYAAWAWAVNGCASVLGAALATWVAIHYGFLAVVSFAVLMYVISVFCLYRLERLK